MSVLLTAEQAQQIEEALLDWKKNFPNHWDLSDKQALATIRAARAQEQAEQEPVAKVVLNRANQITMQKPNGDYFDISKHVGEYFYAAPVSIEAAVLAEREACAKVCEDWHFETEDPRDVAAAIRARSK